MSDWGAVLHDWTAKKGIGAYVIHLLNLNLVRWQEEDDAEDPAVHFGNRDGEDHHPREEAGQGVDYSERNVTKEEPNIRAHTALQHTIKV